MYNYELAKWKKAYQHVEENYKMILLASWVGLTAGTIATVCMWFTFIDNVIY